jgi:hypothetical protein
MSTTTTTSNSSLVTKFLEEKYAEVLRETIANIGANTVHEINCLISRDGKFKGMPKSVVPHEDDIKTGFESVKEMLERGDFPLTDNTLVVCYLSSEVGKKFTTTYFQNALMPLPDRQFPGFTITLSDRVLDQLDDIELSDDSKAEKVLEELEKIWNKKKLSEKIKVKFVYNDGEFGAEDPVMFSVWFAGTLAKKYLSWCKEKMATSSKSSADKSGTTKKRRWHSDSDSDTDSDSDAESYGSPNSKAPKSTSRFSGMNLEEFQKHIKGYNMGQLA